VQTIIIVRKPGHERRVLPAIVLRILLIQPPDQPYTGSLETTPVLLYLPMFCIKDSVFKEKGSLMEDLDYMSGSHGFLRKAYAELAAQRWIFVCVRLLHASWENGAGNLRVKMLSGYLSDRCAPHGQEVIFPALPMRC